MVRKYMQQFFSETPNAENQRTQHRVRLAHIWARQLHVEAKEKEKEKEKGRSEGM